MAGLDDFFAKKDKKKSKGKKFLTAEEVTKKLEDTSKRTVEPAKAKKDRPVVPQNDGVEGGEENNHVEPKQEDEWKDFELEERKDYSGLKIGQLNITEEQKNQTNQGITNDEDYEGDSDGDGNPGSERKFGPWKKVEEVHQIPVVEVEKPSNKIYVSPALRNAPSKALKMRMRSAPDITNEEYFPTLGAARPEEQRKKKNEPAFEEVRHGGRLQRIQEAPSTAPESIANRFKSLEEDDS